MRTRMPGGVGGENERSFPLSRLWAIKFLFSVNNVALDFSSTSLFTLNNFLGRFSVDPGTLHDFHFSKKVHRRVSLTAARRACTLAAVGAHFPQKLEAKEARAGAPKGGLRGKSI